MGRGEKGENMGEAETTDGHHEDFPEWEEKDRDELGALVGEVSLNNCTLTPFGRGGAKAPDPTVCHPCVPPPSRMTPCGELQGDLPGMNNPDASPHKLGQREKSRDQQHKHDFCFSLHIILLTSFLAQFCIHGYQD